MYMMLFCLFIDNFEQISHIALVFLLFTLDKQIPATAMKKFIV